MKKIITIFIISSFFSCSNQSNQNIRSIKGNWYSFDKITKNEIGKYNINYEEVYFDDSIMFSSIESAGIVSPEKYELTNDSLSKFLDEKTKTFIGIIDTITESYYIIRIKDSSKIYYKITGVNTLEDYYSNKTITEDEYVKAFRTRLNEQIQKALEK